MALDVATRKHTCPLADTHIHNPAVQLNYSTCERNTNRDETSEPGRMKTRAGKGVNTHTHRVEAPRPCELTLIRAAEGLTPGGRPPPHSRDSHSPPVNPPGCKRRPTKSCRMWDSHKRDDSDTAASNLRHAQKDAHTILVRVAAGTAAGPSITVMRLFSAMSKICPPSFPNPSYHPVFLKLFFTAVTNREGHMKK